jgi:hypothetical protein
MHITLTDPERIQAFKSGFDLLSVRVFAALDLRNPSPVGRLSRPAKLEYRRDRI